MRRGAATARPAGSAPATFVGAAVGMSTSSVTLPGSRAVGDLILVAAFRFSGGTITTPTGYTLLDSITAADGSIFFVFYRIADGSEGGSVFVSGAANTFAVVYRGTTTSPRATAKQEVTGFGTTVTYPAVASIAGDLVVGFMLCSSSSGTASTPTGHAERFDSQLSGRHGQVVDILNAAGAAGAVNGALSAGTSNSRVTIRAAFAPA